MEVDEPSSALTTIVVIFLPAVPPTSVALVMVISLPESVRPVKLADVPLQLVMEPEPRFPEIVGTVVTPKPNA